MSEKPPAFTDDFLIRQFKTNPPGRYTIALLGTSLFGRFKYYIAHDRHFKENPNVLNLGGSLGADRIRNVQRLIDQGFLRCLKQHQSNLTIIYLQMGDGDITENGLSKPDAQAYGRVVTSLRDKFPDAEIVITSFFQQHGFYKHIIENANEMLRQIVSQSDDAVSFLPFRADHQNIMSNDQIHLTHDGYRKWYDFIQRDIDNRMRRVEERMRTDVSE